MQKEVYEFISKQTGDPIIERRTCRWTGKSFPIFQSERQILDKIAPVINGKKFTLSLPHLSPQVREMRRYMFRNERKFYKFTNSEGKQEITTIAPEMGLKVMSWEKYFDHGNEQYGIDYSGDFQADLKQLFGHVPYPAKLIFNMENSEYCNQETDDKNCYLNNGGCLNENGVYSTYALRTKWTVESYRVWDSEIVFQSLYVYTSQKIFFSQFIENSYNVYFSYDLKSCQNVLFGYGLQNAKYVYKNKSITKKEREKIFQQYQDKLRTHSGLQEILQEYQGFMVQFPKEAVKNINTENCYGSELSNSISCINCVMGEESENVIHGLIYTELHDCVDVSSIGWSQKVYNAASSMHLSNMFSVSHIFRNMHDAYYGYFLQGGNNVLGSIGLNNKSYYILNKKYTKEERHKLAEKIFMELQSRDILGEFLSPDLSPFPYNDTTAYEYYPPKIVKIGKKEEIINSHGYGTVSVLEPEKFISSAVLDLGGEEKVSIKRRTRENEINIPPGMDTILAKDLPDNIDDEDDSILKKVIICEVSGRPFRIVPLELQFYRKHHLPLPRKHPDVRHTERLARRPGRTLYLRECDKCGIEMLSVYSLRIGGDEQQVYCEDCYRKEIYG